MKTLHRSHYPQETQVSLRLFSTLPLSFSNNYLHILYLSTRATSYSNRQEENPYAPIRRSLSGSGSAGARGAFHLR